MTGSATNFNPRAPRGARQGSIIDLKARPRDNFNPRAPRGARLNGIHTKTGNHYFNPRAPRGARPSPPIPGRRDIRDFNPRAPRGARLRYRLRIPARQPYFNPRAPRGARLSRAIDSAEAKSISIHVPREGHDLVAKNTLSRCRRFQSTCPARGTTPLTRVVYPCPAFQSTCPARGTTCHNAQQRPRNAYFNPRAPRGARLSISAYSSRVGSFQSTCPARGTTPCCAGFKFFFRISIHVPREGHDPNLAAWAASYAQFQSTCPARGTTTSTRLQGAYTRQFQSTCPARGTTGHLRRGFLRLDNFNPRAPRGARRAYEAAHAAKFGISIHVPREGHDARGIYYTRYIQEFQSTCPARGTTRAERNCHEL